MRRIDLITQACDPNALTVGQLMQDALFTCTAQTDALTIGRLMTKQNFGGLPVVGSDYDLVTQGLAKSWLDRQDALARRAQATMEESALAELGARH